MDAKEISQTLKHDQDLYLDTGNVRAVASETENGYMIHYFNTNEEMPAFSVDTFGWNIDKLTDAMLEQGNDWQEYVYEDDDEE